jgi:hypothetical protein
MIKIRWSAGDHVRAIASVGLMFLVIGWLITRGLDAAAQPVPAGDARTIRIDPTEVDTYTIRWEGRVLSATPGDHTITITPSGPLKQADASPNAIKTAHAVSGSDLTITLSPNAGCGSSGCRAGNTYQVRIQVTDSAGNRPVYDLLLKVQKAVLQG